MQDNHPSGSRDLVIPPGSYAYVQAENSGAVKTHVGATVATFSGQDRPVIFDPRNRTFDQANQNDAVRTHVHAEEGDYIILDNPSKSGDHPGNGGAHALVELNMGSRVVIPGPCSFALWPSQSAETIAGHNLQVNQYLLVRVYNAEAAMSKWDQGVATPAEEGSDSSKSKKTKAPKDLKTGDLTIVKGNETSFYIPPTGMEVLPEDGTEDGYVRNAVTLERLEYCILQDQDGSKDYQRGPAVIFPQPTQAFVKSESGKKKFRAIELNDISGLHVKVIADYEEAGQEFKAGQELFITGDEQAIYFPRNEHSIIKYSSSSGEGSKSDGQHFAVAVPKGEARYVMDKHSGDVKTARGPEMLLPNPITHVIVRRILSEKEVGLWYPGNREALEYNRDLAETVESLGVAGASAAISEEAYTKSISTRRARRSSHSYSSGAADSASRHAISDEFKRSSRHTPPRSITLDTKFDGVPAIYVFTGYAVMVVNKSGERKVHTGPDNILLEYDETLESMHLSSGKPKTTDNKYSTVYLRIKNNKISDIVAVETKDHVQVDIKVSLKVNFEGDPNLWFESDNYVKLLCDHVRSVLKGAVQKIPIRDLYNNHVALVRDTVLGKKGLGEKGSETGMRIGMVFEENGMIVKDVEVLGFVIQNKQISSLLSGAEFDAVRVAVETQNAQRDVALQLEQEHNKQTIADAKAATQRNSLATESELVGQENSLVLARIATEFEQAGKAKESQAAVEEANNIAHEWKLRREKETSDQRHAVEVAKTSLAAEQLNAESEALVSRFNAMEGNVADALVAIQSVDVLETLAKATSVQTIIGGENVVDVIQKMFAGTAVDTFLKKALTHSQD